MNKITSDCSEGLIQKMNMGGEGYAVDGVSGTATIYSLI